MSARTVATFARLTTLSLALLGAFATSAAFGQRPDSLPVGARLRVTTRVTTPRSLVGVLEAADSSAIALIPNGRPAVLLQYAEIESVDVGRRALRPGGAARGAKRGFLFGLGVTVATVAVAGAIAHAVDYKPSDYSPSVPLTVVIFGVPFTALSTVVGAVIGATDHTVWKRAWPRS